MNQKELIKKNSIYMGLSTRFSGLNLGNEKHRFCKKRTWLLLWCVRCDKEFDWDIM